MDKELHIFSRKEVAVYFDAEFNLLSEICNQSAIILLVDKEVYRLHRTKLEGYNVIEIPGGETSKQQVTINAVVEQLLAMEADRDCWIVGVGGGVVTDIAGYVASIYKRGVKLGLVPTSIMAMADAAIGGKNGIDVGVYKNMVGTIYQPEFILFDYSFLDTLPVKEWVNGFAEIIKHACIRDAALFTLLEEHNLRDFQHKKELAAGLIRNNARIKLDIVTRDEFENGERRLLNFGHTIGHAIENLHQLPHGHAISIGMVAACSLSERLNKLHFTEAARIVKLLAKYHLPVDIDTDYKQVFSVLKLDKKRSNQFIHFVLLKHIGNAETQPVDLKYLEEHIHQLV